MNDQHLAIREPAALTNSDLPSLNEWKLLVEMASLLVPTGFLPQTINTPQKAVAIILKGREVRIPPMYALSNIVVVQGTFRIGAGDTYSEGGLQSLSVGGFTKLPKTMHHFAGAKGETIIQIYGDGPFVITYLNPADDPSKK